MSKVPEFIGNNFLFDLVKNKSNNENEILEEFKYLDDDQLKSLIEDKSDIWGELMKKGYNDIANYILDRDVIDINTTNVIDNSLLMEACSKYNVEIVQRLLDNPEVDVNIKNFFPANALILAEPSYSATLLEFEKAKTIITLLVNDPRLNINERFEGGLTAIMHMTRYTEIFEIVSSHPNIDLTARTDDGRTLEDFMENNKDRQELEHVLRKQSIQRELERLHKKYPFLGEFPN